MCFNLYTIYCLHFIINKSRRILEPLIMTSFETCWEDFPVIFYIYNHRLDKLFHHNVGELAGAFLTTHQPQDLEGSGEV